MYNDHRHIQVTQNVVATVSKNCSVETLELLGKLATVVEDKYNEISLNMESRKLLPLDTRYKNGTFDNKQFNKKNFDELLASLRKYHYALKAAENELFQNSMSSKSDIIFPEKERMPFDTRTYIGISKLYFFSFKKCLKKYHQALESAEYVLLNYKMKK